MDSNLGAVGGGEKGAVTSIPGNEGRVAQVWAKVRGRMRMFAAYFWHTEGWSPRNAACFDEFWSLPILSYRSSLDWTLMSHTHIVLFSNIASVTIPTSCHAMIETSAQVPDSLALRFLFTMSSNIFLAIIMSGSSSDFFVAWRGGQEERRVHTWGVGTRPLKDNTSWRATEKTSRNRDKRSSLFSSLMLRPVHENRTPSYSAFFSHAFHPCSHAPHGSRCRTTCLHEKHVHPHVIMCLTVRCLSSFWNSSSLSSVSTFCPFSSSPLSWSSSSMWSEPPSTKSTAHPQNEEYCPVAIHNPLTGYEPKLLDNFDYSETSAMIFQDESSDIDTEPSYSCDAKLDDELIGKALSSPLITQEREEPANLRQTYHSHEESLLPSLVLFRTHKYGETRIRT